MAMAIFALSLGFQSCEDDDEVKTTVVERLIQVPTHSVQINFNHVVDSVSLVLNTTNKPYQNEKGQAYNVTKLRYLISDITFHQSNGTNFTIDEYHLVDLSNSATLTFNPTTKVPAGDYTAVSFTFGFDRQDNAQQTYADLNSAIWQWPMMLGGGYHFMQFEGTFDTSGVNGGFATHMGTARNLTPAGTTTFEDNHFESYHDSLTLSIPNKTQLNLTMNVNEWYKNPYTWDFKVYNMPIMPVYDAQRKLNLNGPSVFSVEI